MSATVGKWCLLVLLGACLGCTSPFAEFDELSLSRSSCYGPCPVYVVSVKRTGEVTFTGKQNVKAIGTFTDHISQEGIATLGTALAGVDFFKIEEIECFAYSTDNPTITIEVRRGSRVKRVSYYLGCKSGLGSQLKSLAETVDAAANVQQWRLPRWRS